MKKNILLLIIISTLYNLSAIDTDNKFDLTNDSIMKDYRIISSFGDYMNDSFQKGMTLSSKDPYVYSINDSNMIFYEKKTGRHINYPSGDFVFLQSKDNKTRIKYSNLKHIDTTKLTYQKNDYIAEANMQDERNILHFEIEDIDNKRFVNPVTYVGITDRVQPIIKDIYFITSDNTKVSFLTDFRLKRGGNLFINCMDKTDNRAISFTPYQIRVIIGGVESGGIKFDYLRKSENDLLLSNTNYKFDDVYVNSRPFDYMLMNYHSLPGLVGFHIIVEDYAGNKINYRKPLRILPPDL